MTRLFMLMLLLPVLMVWPGTEIRAHALDPGYLNLQQLSSDNWRVFWRKPAVQGAPMAIEARLPETCAPGQGAEPRFDGSAWVSQWIATCPGGLAGQRVGIDGLEATQTDVLLRIEPADGAGLTTRLTPDATGFLVPGDLSTGQVFVTYLALGFEHILEGFDHLLFVFALLVLIQTPARLIGAVTAFTVAHSITLALASLGLLSVPSPPVEAAIALSIVLLAVEILRRGQAGAGGLSERYPWIISFSFGLLHGLGFAGALADIGLPEGDIPMALLSFNLGVEAGQLTFVAAVLVVYGLLRLGLPLIADGLRRPSAPGNVVLGYAIGCVSVWWLAERVAGF